MAYKADIENVFMNGNTCIGPLQNKSILRKVSLQHVTQAKGVPTRIVSFVYI